MIFLTAGRNVRTAVGNFAQSEVRILQCYGVNADVRAVAIGTSQMCLKMLKAGNEQDVLDISISAA